MEITKRNTPDDSVHYIKQYSATDQCCPIHNKKHFPLSLFQICSIIIILHDAVLLSSSDIIYYHLATRVTNLTSTGSDMEQ